jgi:hypothetical protein
MTKSTFTIIAVFVVAITMFAASGCSSLPTWSKGTSSPTQIVAIWDPVIRHEDDKVLRGFAARVMFYDNTTSKKALRVRGNFDVYAFDEDDPTADRITPTRIIRFQVDNLKTLESTSKMFGKSYTIWVPWDEATPDSRKKNISLIVRFTCNDGTMVMSQMAKTRLPGMAPGEDEVEDTLYVNPFQEEKKHQMAKGEALAARNRNNPNSLDTEWKGTVAEHVISSEKRPGEMLTTTINVPGISRDGIPTIIPQRSFASANISNEQQQQAQLLLTNAQTVQTQQGNAVIHQVQFQGAGENGQVYQRLYQQPMLQPSPQQQQQQMNPPSQGLTPMSPEAMYQEFLRGQQQEAMQHQSAQHFPQQPHGNYAAVNTGTTWR